MAASSAEQLARQFAEAVIGKGDMSAADQVLADDFIAYVPISKAPIRGRDNYKKILGGFATAVPQGMAFELHDLFATSDRAVFRFTARGKHEGELFGAPPTGNEIVMGETHVLRIRDGKIVEDYVADNTVDLSQLVGAPDDLLKQL